MKRWILVTLLFITAACRDDLAAIPDAVVMSEDALGHFCQMNLAEHDGPKGQIHLEGHSNPIFFAQVRDTLAYLLEPEKTAPVAAVYVSNMSQAESWAEPGTDNWILADNAWFAIGSDAKGGMGAPEIVPFETEQDALAFITERGGDVVRLDEISAEMVLGAIDRVSSLSVSEERP